MTFFFSLGVQLSHSGLFIVVNRNIFFLFKIMNSSFLEKELLLNSEF